METAAFMQPDCKLLATAVVQLFMTEPPHFREWLKKESGFAAFTKDYGRRCYAIQLFDMSASGLAWEQEFYSGFRYYTTRDYFHSFEARDRLAGLLFLDQEEADRFATAIRTVLLERRRRKDRRLAAKAMKDEVMPQKNDVVPPPAAFSSFLPAPISADIGLPTGLPAWDLGPRAGRRRRLRKDDIGFPTNFRCCASTRKNIFPLDVRDQIREEDCGHEWCRLLRAE